MFENTNSHQSVVTTRPNHPESEQELVKEHCSMEGIPTDPDTADESTEVAEPSSTQSEIANVILPSALNIHNDSAHINEALIRNGDHPAYDDVQLMNAITGRVPTSFKLHTIRYAWDALICYDLNKTWTEAEQLQALATKANVGTRGWRLLRDGADRIGQHNALTEMWLTSRTHAPGPAINCKESHGQNPQ